MSKAIISKEQLIDLFNDRKVLSLECRANMVYIETAIDTWRIAKRIYDDFDIIMASVKCYGEFLRVASSEFWNNKDLLLIAVRSCWSAIYVAPESLRNDRDVIFAAIGNNGIKLLDYPQYLNDKEIILRAISNNDKVYKFLSNEMRQDRDIIYLTLQVNGMMLKYFAPCDDENLVSIAVKSKGRALMYASRRLRNNITITTHAIKNDGLALRYCSYVIKNYIFMVQQALMQNGMALKYVPQKIRNNKQIAEIAVLNNGMALKYCDKILRSDEDIVNIAIKKNGIALKYVDESLRNNRNIVMTAISTNYNAFMFAGAYKADDDVVWVAISNGFPLQELPANLYTMRIALHIIDTLPNAMDLIPPHFKDNKTVMEYAIYKCSYYFRYASERLRNDIDLVNQALNKDGYNITYASDFMILNRDLFLRALQSPKKSIQYINELPEIYETDMEIIVNFIKVHYTNYTRLPLHLQLIKSIALRAANLSNGHDIKNIIHPIFANDRDIYIAHIYGAPKSAIHFILLRIPITLHHDVVLIKYILSYVQNRGCVHNNCGLTKINSYIQQLYMLNTSLIDTILLLLTKYIHIFSMPH